MRTVADICCTARDTCAGRPGYDEATWTHLYLAAVQLMPETQGGPDQGSAEAWAILDRIRDALRVQCPRRRDSRPGPAPHRVGARRVRGVVTALDFARMDDVEASYYLALDLGPVAEPTAIFVLPFCGFPTLPPEPWEARERCPYHGGAPLALGYMGLECDQCQREADEAAGCRCAGSCGGSLRCLEAP